VVLIGRPQLVEAVERQGLRLEMQTFDEHVRVSASTEGSAVQGAQLVLFCMKSTPRSVTMPTNTASRKTWRTFPPRRRPRWRSTVGRMGGLATGSDIPLS
jgi:hypothetical protein